MGASIIGGLFEGVLGFFLKPLRRFFPAVVTGTVVLSIGLSLISVGVSSFGGGSSAADYGSLENLFIGLVVLIIILGVKHFAKGMASSSSILIGIIAVSYTHLDVYKRQDLISHSRFGDKRYSIYSPKSVVEAMLRHKFGTYWNRTETYEALKIYIQMNMDGLKDSVIQMLAGEGVRINTGTFSNDMTTFATKDDVLTLLVHLGYLTYNSETEKAVSYTHLK